MTKINGAYFSRDENQEYDSRFHHTIYETRKEFWFVRRELAMGEHESLQAYREAHIAAADHILDFEIEEFRLRTHVDEMRYLLVIEIAS